MDLEDSGDSEEFVDLEDTGDSEEFVDLEDSGDSEEFEDLEDSEDSGDSKDSEDLEVSSSFSGSKKGIQEVPLLKYPSSQIMQYSLFCWQYFKLHVFLSSLNKNPSEHLKQVFPSSEYSLHPLISSFKTQLLPFFLAA